MKRSSLYYWVWVAVVIAWGASLRWPAIHGSLLADDWDHYAMDVGLYPIARHPLDQFNFVADDNSERAALIASGRMPWWTDPAIHLAVFRPLSSALVQLDFAWLDAAHQPRRAHLHSMLWWTLLICGAAGVMRRLLPPSAAGAALLFFALHGSHGLPVVWIANRSELVAMTFVLWGVWGQITGRSAGRRRLLPLASVSIGFGLLAGEHAIAPLVYLFGFECFGARGAARDRMRALLPAAALTLMYLGVRAALGYGVEGSSFYIDPVAAPARYLAASLTRLPRLAADLVFGWPAESPIGPAWAFRWLGAEFLPRLPRVQIGLGVLALMVLGALGAYAWRERSEERWRHVHWLVLCALLSLLPVCGGLPMSRLTMAAAMGVDAALGASLCALVSRIVRSVRERAGLVRACAAAFALVSVAGIHGFAAARRTRDDVAYYAERSHAEERWALRAELPHESIADKHVMVISAPDWVTQFGLPYVWHLHGLPLPASSEVLSAAVESVHVLTRTGPTTFELRLESERPGRQFANSVYRRENSRFGRGQHIHRPRYDVYVRQERAGEPALLEFVFPHALDDPRYVFLYPRPGGLVRLPTLAVDQSLHLPPPVWPGP